MMRLGKSAFTKGCSYIAREGFNRNARVNERASKGRQHRGSALGKEALGTKFQVEGSDRYPSAIATTCSPKKKVSQR